MEPYNEFFDFGPILDTAEPTNPSDYWARRQKLTIATRAKGLASSVGHPHRSHGAVCFKKGATGVRKRAWLICAARYANRAQLVNQLSLGVSTFKESPLLTKGEIFFVNDTAFFNDSSNQTLSDIFAMGAHISRAHRVVPVSLELSNSGIVCGQVPAPALFRAIRSLTLLKLNG